MMNTTEAITNGPCWIFVAERALTPDESLAIRAHMATFLERWASHGREVRASFDIHLDRMLVMKADESWAHVSGCSRDTLFQMVQRMAGALNMDLMDRMHLPVRQGDELSWMHYQDASEAHEQGQLAEDTMIFDTSVDTVEAFAEGWTPAERYFAR